VKRYHEESEAAEIKSADEEPSATKAKSDHNVCKKNAKPFQIVARDGSWVVSSGTDFNVDFDMDLFGYQGAYTLAESAAKEDECEGDRVPRLLLIWAGIEAAQKKVSSLEGLDKIALQDAAVEAYQSSRDDLD